MSFKNRPDKPVASQFYVKLVTEKAIRKQTVKKFYSIVDQYSPENVLTIYEIEDLDGNPAQSVLVHRMDEHNQHNYEIPLTRNLTSNEIHDLVIQLDTSLNEGDFLFETSTFDDECCDTLEYFDEYMEQEETEQISIKLAERLHDTWMHERLEKGWRYSSTRSDEEKTHPLLKPWEQLSEEHKAIDFTLPQLFIDLLEEYGYTVISTDELEGLSK